MKKEAEKKLNHLFERYPALEECRASIMTAAEMMIASYENGGRLRNFVLVWPQGETEYIAGQIRQK